MVSAWLGNANLNTDVQDILIAIKAPAGINASNIVSRLRTQTCAGCHQFSDTKQGPVGFDDKDGLGEVRIGPQRHAETMLHPVPSRRS
jgi:hypothetical protein